MQDIQALDEKITALVEQSHVKDVAMLASLNEEPGYYTKEESDNKYALKSDVINVVWDTMH